MSVRRESAHTSPHVKEHITQPTTTTTPPIGVMLGASNLFLPATGANPGASSVPQQFSPNASPELAVAPSVQSRIAFFDKKANTAKTTVHSGASNGHTAGNVSASDPVGNTIHESHRPLSANEMEEDSLLVRIGKLDVRKVRHRINFRRSSQLEFQAE